MEPPHQVMNDGVMKRKFLAHCTANKGRIVKPLAAVLSSAAVRVCRVGSIKEPSTEDEGDL